MYFHVLSVLFTKNHPNCFVKQPEALDFQQVAASARAATAPAIRRGLHFLKSWNDGMKCCLEVRFFQFHAGCISKYMYAYTYIYIYVFIYIYIYHFKYHPESTRKNWNATTCFIFLNELKAFSFTFQLRCFLNVLFRAADFSAQDSVQKDTFKRSS